MTLSVIIVNYNVKHFLAQCLQSVAAAIKNIDAEVFVVDNHSVDDSAKMVAEKFAWVKLIANKDNTGFSRANNQAIREAKGKYILLVNPDTIVAEDTFEKCVEFMDANSIAGGLGVNMIDGKGNFLPESKRGLPTPAVAFYKMFGLSFLFPKSQTFGKYHLGYLDENQNCEAEILSGAFMLMRKDALDKVGLLDETFFMYGEDIDLSYRIQKAGYKNFYFSDTTIIHYKGESTKKGSLNYVKVFYQAMIIFARKHFTGSSAGIFTLLINAAVVFRAILTLITGILASSLLPIIDALLMFLSIAFIQNYWASNIKFAEHYYPEKFLLLVVPIYIVVWIFSVLLSGGYERPYRISRVFRGIVIGSLLISAAYGLLPNEWRFSRAIIILGAASSGLVMLLTRTFYNLYKHNQFSIEPEAQRTIAVAGDSVERKRTINILNHAGIDAVIVETESIAELATLQKMFDVNEVIFCAASFDYKSIIEAIKHLGKQTEYKIINPGSGVIIGSNSKNTAGDIYADNTAYALSNPLTLRKKRLMDLTVAILGLLLFPISVFIVRNAGNFFSSCMEVIRGTKTWIGYCGAKSDFESLPKIPTAVFAIDKAKNTDAENRAMELNKLYAKRYKVSDELVLIINALMSR